MLFHPEDRFFIIDSLHLNHIQSDLYGFCVIDERVIAAYKDLHGRTPDGNGSYVLIEKENDALTITQDAMGRYGLFLFQSEDNWILSNNFQYLADYVKGKYPLTLNKDYADAFILESVCSHVYKETLFREITWLDRHAVVSIGVSKASISVNISRKPEKTISVDSEQGLARMDEWHDKWVAIISRLTHEWKGPIMTDLSGGMDSRMVLTLFLDPQVDLDRVIIASHNDTQRNHIEDYGIAKQIAENCGFKLNLNKGQFFKERNFSLQDIVAHTAFHALGFHKQFFLGEFIARNPFLIHFGGHGGEHLRRYFTQSILKFEQNHYSHLAYKRLNNKALKCIKGANEIIRRSIIGFKSLYSDDSASLIYDGVVEPLYIETRNRNHYGEATKVIGGIRIGPLLDPQLLELQESGLHSDDNKLLYAIMCARYGKDLLDYPIERNRTISPETIAYARELCNKYPYKPRERTKINKFPQEVYADPIGGNMDVWKEPCQHNQSSKEDFDSVFNRAFLSPTVRGLFTSVYDDELYNAIKRQPLYVSWHPYADWHAALAIAKAIYDTKCLDGKKEVKNTVEFIMSCAEEISPEKYNMFVRREKAEAFFIRVATAYTSKIRQVSKRLKNSLASVVGSRCEENLSKKTKAI